MTKNLEKLFEVKCNWYEVDPNGQSEKCTLEQEGTFYIPAKTPEKAEKICEINKEMLVNSIRTPVYNKIDNFYVINSNEFKASIPNYKIIAIKEK